MKNICHPCFKSILRYNHNVGSAAWNIKSDFAKYKNQKIFDGFLAEYLLSESKYSLELEETFKRYKVSSLDELIAKQQELLGQNPKLQDLFNSIEMPLVEVLSNMESRGIILDSKKLTKVGEQLDKAIIELDEEIKKEFGGGINLNSSTQVGNYLSEKVGVPLAKTKTGKYATNEAELVKHQNQFPIIQKLLSFRQLTKLKSTYVESLVGKIAEDKRVHTTYSQAGIATGRLSSANPNLQNIPVTSEFGRKIKSCFVASENYTLVSFDYSQQELRVLAHLTQEEKLIEAFKNNRDVHKLTASQIFNTDYDKVTKEQRAIGKTINFGIIYGMGSFGLSEALQIPQHDADLFIKNFYKNFPKIKVYYDNFFKEGMKQNYVETLLGRRRFVFLNPKQKFMDNQTRRILLNFPIQGTAADLMKKAMVEIDKKILKKNKNIFLLLQIHDDLVFEMPTANKTQLNKVIKEIKEVMCDVYPLSVPIDVDIKIGTDWGNMEAFS